MRTRSDEPIRSGFTLIEMLIVILIILLLSGMLFKIAGMVGEKAARARAVADIANLENALAEYYSEYNIYPPTSGNAYVYENTAGQPESLKSVLDAHAKPQDSNDPDFITDTDARVVPTEDERTQFKSTKGAIGYKYGLVSYLWPRAQGGQPHWYDKDTKRDESAKLKWQHYLKDLTVKRYGVEEKRVLFGTTYIYTNSMMVVKDPWDHAYNYECKPPYMQYRLWSNGPDGNSGTADDINNKSFNE